MRKGEHGTATRGEVRGNRCPARGFPRTRGGAKRDRALTGAEAREHFRDGHVLIVAQWMVHNGHATVRRRIRHRVRSAERPSATLRSRRHLRASDGNFHTATLNRRTVASG